jgi:hypothetical protein
MKNITTLVTILLLAGNTVLAQTNKQSQGWDDNDTEKPVRFNYVVDDPMDAFGPGKTPPEQRKVITVYTVPEFYFPSPRKVKDTTFTFLCYDSRDTLIKEVSNFDLVHYYSLFKEYNDPVHTYNDNGIKKPLPISSIVKRYDQIAKDKWMSVEYPRNKYTELKGFRNTIVKTDTLGVIDPATGAGIYHIYKYYKVTKN